MQIKNTLRTRGLLPFTIVSALFVTPSAALAQRADITSPGTTPGGALGQSTRFDNDTNPAISLSFDVIGDWTEYNGASEDGVNLELRLLDVLMAGWIDPNAYGWTTVAYHDGELELEEAAIEYVGLPGNHTLRAGRFFVDFGKQMQQHLEELRTPYRPLVLREFLGDELAGEGLQWDHWTSLGDATMVRYSVGAFNDISGGGHGHGHEEEGGEAEAEIHVADRKKGENLGFTGRLTALTEVGENGTVQVGLSGRWLTDFAFEVDDTDLEMEDLSNSVYGVDLSYGWVAGDGISNWTVGGEYLMFDGDLSAHVVDNGGGDELELFNDEVSGAYAFIDHGWSRFDSAGIQYSMVEEPEEMKLESSELDVYYTRRLSEFLRLRIAATLVDNEEGEDSGRLAIQLTGFVGPHSHGLNW